jgi:hypothetical protein
MGVTPIRLHILQEYGVDFRPHPTSYISRSSLASGSDIRTDREFN